MRPHTLVAEGLIYLMQLLACGFSPTSPLIVPEEQLQLLGITAASSSLQVASGHIHMH